MTDKILVEDLANAPPQHWAEMVARAAVFETFVHKTASVAQADLAAATLKIKRRRFYRLLAAYRTRRAGGQPFRSMHGASYWIDEEKEKAIKAAIDSVGAGGRLCDAHRETIRICGLRGITPPSIRPVRTRFAKVRASSALLTRLNTGADIIVDLCGLAIAL